MGIEIRRCTKDDEQEIIEICHKTGDISVDQYLFGLRWCLYYVWYETENCFVAVDTEVNKVVGYILSTNNTIEQEKIFESEMVPLIRKRWKQLKKKNLKIIIKYYMYMKLRKLKQLNDVIKKYPAHLHIDIDPNYQRRGIGHKLMKAFEQNAIEKGAAGFHLVVDASNEKGGAFYKKYGLTKIKDVKFLGKVLGIAYGKSFIKTN